MNQKYNRSNKSGSVNFDFDLGIDTNRSNKPLNAQKNPNSNPNPNPNLMTSSWQNNNINNNNRASWTHQPAAASKPLSNTLNGPTSMVGDITGRSWASASGSTATSNNIGIASSKNSNLFSDLLGGNLGGGKGNYGNVALKNVANVSGGKSGFSMGGMADSLPKSGGVGGWGGSQGYGNYNTSGYGSKSQGLGGPSMKSGSLNGGGSGMGVNKDPFGSLVDFSVKGGGGGGMKSGSRTSGTTTTTSGGDAFGSFQNASKSSGNGFNGSGVGSQSKFDDFGFVGMQSQPPVQSSSMGSGIGSQSNLDDFGFGNMQSQPPVQSSGGNDFDLLFSSSTASAANASKGSDNFASEQFAGAEDWGFESDIGGGDDVGGTTELEGLPPPPAGVTSSSAKSKGMDNYKAGQYPDAIKWLSWAVVLLEKGGDKGGAREVLSSRASCYKEVGEYKKAVADCTKVLEQDSKNVSVLVQRALLYESMEKYKLGAEDLRTVMNIDPGNRVARSTIHRLTKLAS